MEYLLTPYAKPFPPWVWWEGAFTESELDWLQEKAKGAENVAKVGAGAGVEGSVSNIRRSQVDWLHNNQETEWVYKKLAHVASSLSADWYGFNLTGFGEPFQLTNYDEVEKGMYGWHQDYGGGISRKLSLVLQLTDPAQYEGGNLEVMTSGTPAKVRKQRGLIAAFPSYVLHQVTPVTQGTRQSLVAWVSGPQFK